ncbi:hypothetical protein SRABI06_04414 [Pseudomonas brassicacearum]|nr:hypothetical protein SRABI06_04414 [Pseudomonas brassicacearum]
MPAHHRSPNVGASLLAKAVGQLASMLDVLPPSRAGSLPQYFETASEFLPAANPLWERACSRKRWASLHRCWMCWRHREQARSHSISRAPPKFLPTANPLWERACSRKRWVILHRCWMCYRHREQARSHSISRPPPSFCPPQIPCGSEPARESGGPACIDVGCAGAIASRLAPTVFRDRLRVSAHRKSFVGASLLAKAVGQLASMLDVLAPSRASSPPQYFETASEFLPTANPLWERACSRKRWASLHRCWMCYRHREQARSHSISRAPPSFCPPQTPCGSEPARESGGSSCIDVGCATAIASKLAPTVFRDRLRVSAHRKSLVGASLLAKAAAQPIEVLIRTPRSSPRFSRKPQ